MTRHRDGVFRDRGGTADRAGGQGRAHGDQYLAIQKAVNRAAQAAPCVAEIRNAFERAKTARYFEAVSGKDLEISKDGDRIVVEFAYDKEIHLFGPAYLLLKYRGRNS